MSMIRIGLIGCGGFGARHAAAWRKIPGVSLHAVFDPDTAKARAVAGADTHVFEQLGDLLACVDAVTIVTPPHLHAEMVRRALGAGLHALVEKPFGTCARVADELSDAALAKGRVLAVGYLERFHPAINRALGGTPAPMRLEVERINCRRPRDAATGLIFDLMSHDIDLALRWFNGTVCDFRASAKAADDGVIDEAAAELVFADGRTASLRSSWRGTSRRRAIRMAYDDRSRQIDLLDDGHGVDLLHAELSDFAAAMRGRAGNLALGVEAARTLSVARRITDAFLVTETAS